MLFGPTKAIHGATVEISPRLTNITDLVVCGEIQDGKGKNKLK